MLYRGKEFHVDLSEISGDTRVTYGSEPVDVEVPMYDETKVVSAVSPPLGYIVPAAWSDVIERLRLHGLRLARLTEQVTAEFETYRLVNPTWSREPFENHHPVAYTTVAGKEVRTLAVGSVLVRLNQSTSKIAVHLLEPDAPDSLAAWGYFDAIFEQKEYGESYVLEELARTMLAKDTALKQEFFERLRSDPAFRGDPSARLSFFFERSPYWDSRVGAYPVVRLVKSIPLKTAAL